MDSVMDAFSLSIQRVPSPKVILSVETCASVPTEMAGAYDNESSSWSSTIDSTISVPVDDSAPRLEQTTVISKSSSSCSSSSPSSVGPPMGPPPFKSQQYSYVHNQNNHQHYPSDRFGRANGFNSKGGKRGGYGLPKQNFSNRRHQQQRAGFVNMQQQIHGHGFFDGSSGFPRPPMPPPPPFPYFFQHSTPMVRPPYINHLPPPPPPIPGYMFPYYGNVNYSVRSPPPYVDAMSGALTYNQPIFPYSEVGLCYKILYQIEYYFSKENLETDFYMKSLMDDEGWIPVRLIAAFRRVKAMTKDIDLIVRSLQLSAIVEVQGDKMRKRGDWMNWVRNRSTDAQISSVTDISTGIENIHLREKAGADALVADDRNHLHAQMKGSGAS